MDVNIYKERELDYDRVLSELFNKLDILPVGSDERKETLSEIERLSHLAAENGRILLDSEKNALKEQELSSADVVSDEQKQLKERELDIRERELELQKQLKEQEVSIREKDTELQNQIKSRELDVRERELLSSDSQALMKSENDARKIEIEDRAVKARFGGEVIGFASTLAGVIGTLVGLGTAMAFERREDGGILNSKFLSTIFRMK